MIETRVDEMREKVAGVRKGAGRTLIEQHSLLFPRHLPILGGIEKTAQTGQAHRLGYHHLPQLQPPHRS